MARTLTEYFEKKGFKQEKRDKIVSLFKEHWNQWSREANVKKVREQLLELLGNNERLELTERKFSLEYTEFDRLFHHWRLKDDPLWEKIRQELKVMDETKKCPFCLIRMAYLPKESGRDDSMKCRSCNRVFNLS